MSKLMFVSFKGKISSNTFFSQQETTGTAGLDDDATGIRDVQTGDKVLLAALDHRDVRIVWQW